MHSAEIMDPQESVQTLPDGLQLADPFLKFLWNRVLAYQGTRVVSYDTSTAKFETTWNTFLFMQFSTEHWHSQLNCQCIRQCENKPLSLAVSRIFSLWFWHIWCYIETETSAVSTVRSHGTFIGSNAVGHVRSGVRTHMYEQNLTFRFQQLQLIISNLWLFSFCWPCGVPSINHTKTLQEPFNSEQSNTKSEKNIQVQEQLSTKNLAQIASHAQTTLYAFFFPSNQIFQPCRERPKHLAGKNEIDNSKSWYSFKIRQKINVTTSKNFNLGSDEDSLCGKKLIWASARQLQITTQDAMKLILLQNQHVRWVARGNPKILELFDTFVAPFNLPFHPASLDHCNSFILLAVICQLLSQQHSPPQPALRRAPGRPRTQVQRQNNCKVCIRASN